MVYNNKGVKKCEVNWMRDGVMSFEDVKNCRVTGWSCILDKTASVLLFHSTLRFQLPRQRYLLPFASSPSTYPVTAKTNLRPALTVSTSMFPGKEVYHFNLKNKLLHCDPNFLPQGPL